MSCPSLPGCYSQGETIDEALDNIKEAIELCMEDMKAHDESVPDPSKTLIGPITIPNHKVLKPGLLRSILLDTKVSVEEFSEPSFL